MIRSALPLLLLSALVAAEVGDPRVPVPEDLRACRAYADCVEVETSCSQCCGLDAVAKARLSDYEEKKRKQCGDYRRGVCNCVAVLGKPECVHGKCRRVTKTVEGRRVPVPPELQRCAKKAECGDVETGCGHDCAFEPIQRRRLDEYLAEKRRRCDPSGATPGGNCLTPPYELDCIDGKCVRRLRDARLDLEPPWEKTVAGADRRR